MLLSLVYLVVRVLLRLLVPEGQDQAAQGSRDSRAPTSAECPSANRSNGPAFDFPIGYFSPPRLDDCHGLVGSVSS